MTAPTERLVFDSSAELVSTAASRFIAAVTAAQEARGIA
ncbi:MAG: 6-phosphogluconolactonase, partial [Gordonia sp. (in: high G+C Gram-positive bacteria)]